MIAPVELVRELLYYRDMRMIDHRDWGLITRPRQRSPAADPRRSRSAA
jgi:hypothetical protein